MMILYQIHLLIVGTLVLYRCPLVSSKDLTVRISPKRVTQYFYQSTIFYCYVSGNPQPLVSWYVNSENVLRVDRAKIHKVPGGYMMRYDMLHPRLDNGTVECRGTNGVDPPASDVAQLHVLLKKFNPLRDPSLPPGIPKPFPFTYDERDIIVVVGANLTLVANVSGNPVPKITWFKNGRLLDKTNPRLTLLKNNSLVFTKIQMADEGKYDYMAENDKGQIFSPAWRVYADYLHTKPVIRPGLKNQLVNPETDVVLNCSVTAYPEAFVYWEDSRGRRISHGSLLQIKNIQKSEGYTCIAKNLVGNAMIKVNVTVRELPFAPIKVIAASKTGHTITVSWQDGKPGKRVDRYEINYRKKGDRFWRKVIDIYSRNYTLDDLETYVDYEVQVFALNNLGKSKGSKISIMKTEETVPGSAPRSVVVKSTSTGSFDVSWQPPEYPNGVIIFYTVYYTSDRAEESWEKWHSKLVTASLSTRVTSRVQKDRRYAVKVSSSTYPGGGPLSETLLVQSLKGAPSDPRNVRTKVISSTKVQVTWSKPAYKGSGQGIVGYDIYFNTSFAKLRKGVSIQSSDVYSKIVTGLRPATTYKFHVSAKTRAGSGPYSFPQFATTLEDAPSAPPRSVTCKAINEKSIHCSWQSPPRHGRNGPITGYAIRYKNASENTFVRKSVGGSVLSWNFGSLQAYTVYHIEVAAKNSKGQGPFSHPVVVTTNETRPSRAPENLTAIAINSTAILVTWNGPSPPFGAKLTGYSIWYREKPQDREYIPFYVVGDKTREIFTGLKPKQEYEFVIFARSVKGRGVPSNTVSCKTKQSPPPPPHFSLVKLIAPLVGVTLTWTSKAEDLEMLKLRYAKEVEEITNKTLFKKLTYVEERFLPSDTSHKLGNLEHGLWYLFKLSVKNPGGWSSESEASLTMDAAKPAGPPLNFRVQPKSSTAMQLLWDLPEKWKRNGKIIGYKLSYLIARSSEKSKVENLGDERTYELRDLRKFTSYKFWISAKTVAGEGPNATIEGKTKEDKPSDSPTLTEAKGLGTKVVKLRFEPPLIPNGQIVGYKVNVYMSDPTKAGEWKSVERSGNITMIYVKQLIHSNSRYWFTVAAGTSVGYGPPSEAITAYTLKYDVPLPVQRLSVDKTSSSLVRIHWESPVVTAAVHSYKISYRGEKTFIGPDKKPTRIVLPEKIKTVQCCKQTLVSLENLEPRTSYTITIVSMDRSSGSSEAKELKVKTGVSSSPLFPKPSISRDDITDEYIPIYVHAASERYGPISHYVVHVASLGTTLSEAQRKLQNIKHSRSRRATNANNRSDVYVAGKLNANVVPTTFKVSRNKNIVLDRYYAFSVQSCVLNEDSLCLTTSTVFTDPVKFSLEQNALNSAAPGGEPSSSNNLWLLGPVCAVAFLIIIVFVICLLWRRRARRRRHSKSLKKLVHDEQLPMMTSPRDPVEMQRLNLETEGMRDHPPIHISELDRHIEHLHSNNNNFFTREYESIDPGMTFTSDTSAHHLNHSKNRYPNIIPYDHTRVVLQDTNGFLDSDYINANYMAGYRKPNAYIATQAPLTNTINDLWQMIWEQDTRTIVMMTCLQEKGRVKCDQYWPNQSSEKFGNIFVFVQETVALAHYTVRTFRLCKDGQTDKYKEIKQYQYTAWPDHGVPHYSTSLLCFIRRVRLANPSDAGPVVVHCSAGVGRTGVFIVIDSMLERIRREQTVDVYGHVTLLRSQRNHMVQTEEQYIFIHETLLEAVLFGNTEIHASDLSQYYKKLNEINENETTSIEEHFKQLSIPSRSHRFVTASLSVNKSKNRYPKILPYEHSRVDLVPIRSVDGSNYINASYIDGYKQRRTYIAAQGPLEETVNDFWRMIMEKKANIIVMLSGTDESDQEMSAKYWPCDQSAKYHFYIVDPVSVEETPNFTLRQFKVNDMMSTCPSLIKLFQLRKWPDRGKPQSYKAILDLIGQVHTARNNDDSKGPVIVHCGSGSGRTGVFCALSIVVERMRAEGVVDLLQTVRQLREQRPQMVETLQEYAFCYEAALQYLSSFDHITA